jgi:hypothetical protein
VIRTVALETTMKNVAALGLLVIVRTFLSWAVSVEVEGHWPWPADARSETGAAQQRKMNGHGKIDSGECAQ